MFVNFIISSCIALVLNFLSFKLSLNYLWSVILVFGGVSVFFLSNAVKQFTKQNWKLFFSFFLLSNILTLIVEVLMVKMNVWGFSNRVYPLTGITIFTFPFEEFVYWGFCPIIVTFSYILLGKTIGKFNLTEFVNVVKTQSARKLLTTDAENVYVEDDESGKYSSGSKIATYIWIQAFLLATIIMLTKYYRGNWKSALYTTYLFFFVTFPNELYSIHQGFWLYNSNKLLGLFLFKIPLEAYLMYFLPPICGCIFLDLMNKFINKEDI